MKIHLIEGEFNSKDAIELVSQMIQIKIKYHESKIDDDSNEEDIKIREAKIKRFQYELFELRKTIQANTNVFISSRLELVIKNGEQ